jgi:hypothetical protein
MSNHLIRACVLVGFAVTQISSSAFGGKVADTFKKVDKQISTDESKADQLIIGRALYQVARKNDSSLAYTLMRVCRAKSAREVDEFFSPAEMKDEVTPFIDRKSSVWLAKKGVDYFLKSKELAEPVKELIDAVNDFTEKIENDNTAGKASLEEFPKKYTAAMLAGGLNDLVPEIRHEVILQLSNYLGQNYDEVVRNVREGRILSDGD